MGLSLSLNRLGVVPGLGGGWHSAGPARSALPVGLRTPLWLWGAPLVTLGILRCLFPSVGRAPSLEFQCKPAGLERAASHPLCSAKASLWYMLDSGNRQCSCGLGRLTDTLRVQFFSGRFCGLDTFVTVCLWAPGAGVTVLCPAIWSAVPGTRRCCFTCGLQSTSLNG